MKPPHRIPKIDVKQSGGNDHFGHYALQSSPNRYDSRLEKRKGDHFSQTPVNGNHNKVKKPTKVIDITDAS